MKGITPKAVGGIAGVVAALIAYVATFHGMGGFLGGVPVERQIEKMAADLNRGLPKQTDPVTRWDRVEAGPGKSVSYIYTISTELTDPEKQTFRESVTSKLLVLPEMQPLLDAGVTVWFKYHDAAGSTVLEFPVKK